MPPTALRRRRERCVLGEGQLVTRVKTSPSPAEGHTPPIQIDTHISSAVSSYEEDLPPSPSSFGFPTPPNLLPTSSTHVRTHTHSHTFTHVCTHLHTHAPFLVPNIPSSHTLVPLPLPLLPFLLSTNAPRSPQIEELDKMIGGLKGRRKKCGDQMVADTERMKWMDHVRHRTWRHRT